SCCARRRACLPCATPRGPAARHYSGSRSSAAGNVLHATVPLHFAARRNRRRGAAQQAASRPCAGQLRNQALAALGTARRQNLAAIGGFHAGAKAVGAGALQHAGLISAFHGWLRGGCPRKAGQAWKKTGDSKGFHVVASTTIFPACAVSATSSAAFRQPVRLTRPPCANIT